MLPRNEDPREDRPVNVQITLDGSTQFRPILVPSAQARHERLEGNRQRDLAEVDAVLREVDGDRITDPVPALLLWSIQLQHALRMNEPPPLVQQELVQILLKVRHALPQVGPAPFGRLCPELAEIRGFPWTV